MDAGPEERILIDACLRLGVPFSWRGAGFLLISGSGVRDVVRDVSASGHIVIGLEGFELESNVIRPRLDLIFDSERRTDVDAAEVLAEWPQDVWVDVTFDAPG